jgi:hypothetical protein
MTAVSDFNFRRQVFVETFFLESPKTENPSMLSGTWQRRTSSNGSAVAVLTLSQIWLLGFVRSSPRGPKLPARVKMGSPFLSAAARSRSGVIDSHR